MLGWHFILCILFLVNVTAHLSNVYTFWSKKIPIAGHMAVRAALMLCMTTRGQCFLAPHTAKTRPVPVTTQWHHLLSEINCLSTAGTQISLSSKHTCRHSGSFRLIEADLGAGPRCGGRTVWRAVTWFVDGCLSRCFVYVRPRPTNIYTFWSKECSIAGFMTVRQSIMLFVTEKISLIPFDFCFYLLSRISYFSAALLHRQQFFMSMKHTKPNEYRKKISQFSLKADTIKKKKTNILT